MVSYNGTMICQRSTIELATIDLCEKKKKKNKGENQNEHFFSIFFFF
jgi:hypothetical protein